MDPKTANMFVVPMGFGGAMLLHFSAYRPDGSYSLLTNNDSYDKLIATVFAFSFVYFIIDFFLMIKKYTPKYNTFFVHHGISIVSILAVYFNSYYLIKFLLAYLTYELSTPFLNMSIYYRNKRISTWYSVATNLLFFISYTIVRVLFGTYLLFKAVPLLLSGDGIIPYLAILPIILQAMIFYWYKKIFYMFKRQISGEKIEKKKE